ncbi:hypothetical protein H4Q26_013548 [Puccinia striiformis f. sp. tritici PST-130]|nr:hypothetical protein H4Q26_013548 [Puccinia striiformis f. sp. tritici PST-130]
MTLPSRELNPGHPRTATKRLTSGYTDLYTTKESMRRHGNLKYTARRRTGSLARAFQFCLSLKPYVYLPQVGNALAVPSEFRKTWTEGWRSLDTFLSTSHRSSLQSRRQLSWEWSQALWRHWRCTLSKDPPIQPRQMIPKLEKPCTENPVHDESLIAEQLARNLAFLGPPGNQNVRNAFVIIIGLGGQALVEQFTIADAPRLLDGNPDWGVGLYRQHYYESGSLDILQKDDLKVFSALGAASKADPSRIQIADISMTFEDPLARSVRRRLRQNGIIHGVPVVYSTESLMKTSDYFPLPEEEFQKGNVGELSALADFRVRILPVLGPLPSMFGQAMAAHTITQLANFPTQPLPIKNRTKVYHRIFNDLLAREFRLNGATTIPFSDEDIGYIFEDLYRGRSVVHPAFKVSSHPCMIRWSMDEELHWTNCVVMDRSEADIHQQKVLVDRQDPRLVWGSETVELVKARFSEELQMSVSPPTRSCNINIFPVLFFI